MSKDSSDSFKSSNGSSIDGNGLPTEKRTAELQLRSNKSIGDRLNSNNCIVSNLANLNIPIVRLSFV